jgi:hypothetical protein
MQDNLLQDHPGIHVDHVDLKQAWEVVAKDMLTSLEGVARAGHLVLHPINLSLSLQRNGDSFASCNACSH